MEEMTNEDRESLDLIALIPLLHAQDWDLERLDVIDHRIQHLFDFFDDVRSQDPVNDLNREKPDCFEVLIESVMLLFLSDADPSHHQTLCEQSRCYSDEATLNLSDCQGIPHADLLLRKLQILCRQSASEKYQGEVRSAKWNRRITELEARLEVVKSEWVSTRFIG